METPQIILDTDMDTDVDDAGALAVLYALADRGEARVLGTVVSSAFPWSPLCLHALNIYYGRQDLPLGTLKGPGASIHRGSRYAEAVAREFPCGFDAQEDVPDAVTVYRRLLAAAAPREVTVVTIGYMTNLRNLLASRGDAISPLRGEALVRRSVKEWVCMGGRFPKQTDPREWGNFKPDPEAVITAVNDWPSSVPITFFDGRLGHSMQAGSRLLAAGAHDNPVRRAYELFLAGKRDHHHCCDLGAVLYAVRGLKDYWEREEEGYNHIFPDGTHEWRPQPNRNQSYLLRKQDPAEVAEILDSLLAQGPQVG